MQLLWWWKETQVGINLHKDSSISLHQQQCDKNCFSMIMNLPWGTSSCLPSHQSEQPAQVSPARRTSRGSTACFTSSRWVGRLEEEVSSTPGDSLTAALPETTKVIGWWNDRPHSYPHSEGKETDKVLDEGGYQWHVSLYFGDWFCLPVWLRVKISSCTLPFTFNMPTVLKAAEERLVLEHEIFYKGILVKYDLHSSESRSRETTSVMDDREISIWAGGETSNYEKGGTCSFIPRGTLRALASWIE